MRKKIYLFPLCLLGFFMLVMASCLNNNDNNDQEIDEAWKSLNDSRFAAVASDPSFTALSSQSGNGKVYWKVSNEIKNVNEANLLKMTVAGKPEFTDTVVVRYEGWYFDKDGKQVIFDSTENPSSKSKLDYTYNNVKYPSPDPNHVQAKFAVNGVIDGWTTLLQDMKTGDERLVCVPYELGYRGVVNTYKPTTSSPTFTLIPAYTTLWFRLKIYKIIPMKGLK